MLIKSRTSLLKIICYSAILICKGTKVRIYLQYSLQIKWFPGLQGDAKKEGAVFGSSFVSRID